MLEKELAPEMRRVYFHRALDNPARVEWEYRHEGICLLKYMACPVVGDSGRLVFKRGLSDPAAQEAFRDALWQATDRWFVSDGWVVDLPEGVVNGIDIYLDDVLAEKTEIEEENAARYGSLL